jgi:hypothetical protein
VETNSPTCPTTPLRAALFVDFDNMQIGLERRDPAAARRFATRPAAWLGWLAQGGHARTAAGPPVPRRVLMRRCYLNPEPFGRFRPALVGAGFQVVDCPPLTRAGKTVADMCMALDMIDALAHPTRFDEFILLSADADFTPALARLRAHDRSCTVVAAGPAAAAQRAAADVFVPVERLMAEALAAPGAGEPVDAVPAGTPPGLRDRLLHEVRAMLVDSTAPLPMAQVGMRLRALLDAEIRASAWAGFRSLKALLKSATDPGIRIVDRAPGFVLDPRRHERPQA